MNPQLAAFFAAHKPAILAGGAAAVVGLAYVQRKRSAGAGVATTAGASVPSIAGTIPAAAVVPTGSGGGGGTYDSSSYDTYNALQPELGTIAQLLQAQAAAATSAGSGTAGGGPAPASSPILNTPAPAPVTAPKLSIAQSLFRANATGNYVKYGDGTIGEVESDGSIYGLAQGEVMSTGQMWNPTMGATVLPWQHWNDNPAAEPTYGDKVHNLAAAGKA